MVDVRTLHPLAWWSWGISLAIATSRAGNFWLLGGIIFAAIIVTFSRRSDDPWANALSVGIKIACIALLLRMFIAILFSIPEQGKVLFTIPRIKLPEWLAGIFLGGDVTQERLQFVLLESLTIFALVVAIAAASSLANPKQTLRALPGVLHEAGVALIIATTLIPHFVMSVKRIRQARALRGDEERFGFKKTLVPLFEEALERALILAESMEARGYGHKTEDRNRLFPTLAMFAGLLALLYSIISLVIGNSYQISLTLSSTLIIFSLYLGNRNNSRTKYRPQKWGFRETFVLIMGVISIVVAGASFTLLLAILLFLVALAPMLVTRRESVLT